MNVEIYDEQNKEGKKSGSAILHSEKKMYSY